MSFLSKISSSISSVVHNVTQTIVNPVNTIKNSLLLGPISGQAGASIFGPSATPQQAAVATAVGASAVLLGGLAAPAAGPVAGATSASSIDLAAGTVYGTSVAPASTAAVNGSLFDSWTSQLGLGKALSYLSNPGAATPSGSSTTTTVGNTGAAQPITINWGWVLGIGGGALVLWLLIQKR